jgi:hypothetical protein
VFDKISDNGRSGLAFPLDSRDLQSHFKGMCPPALALVLLCSGALDPALVERARAAYQKLGSDAIEAKPSPSPSPPAHIEFARIDVSERMRSASFGHATTLLVPLPAQDGGSSAPAQFWVEYGRSTNSPARLFGPFPLAEAKK